MTPSTRQLLLAASLVLLTACLQADDSVSGCINQQCWSTPPYCFSSTLCIFLTPTHLPFLCYPVTIPASVSPAAPLF